MRPGILGIFDRDPEMGVLLSSLAECLLRRDSTLAVGERELIATYVSGLNNTPFCRNSHGMVAYGWGMPDVVVYCCQQGLVPDDLPDRLKAMLEIARAVTIMGPLPVTDMEERETLEVASIAAAFAMFNRLVMLNPTEPSDYRAIARHLIDEGYLQSGIIVAEEDGI